MEIGRMVFDREREGTTIQTIQEYSCIRYHLGYCRCGERIVVGPEQAGEMMRVFERKGIRAKRHVSFPWVWISPK